MPSSIIAWARSIWMTGGALKAILLRQARRKGEVAARNGEPQTNNPYNNWKFRLAWCDGYRSVDKPATKRRSGAGRADRDEGFAAAAPRGTVAARSA
jgi:hypothetical protein